MLNRSQKNQVLKDHIEARAKGRLDKRYEVEFVPKAHSCQTGCWRWDADTGKNVILINSAIDEHCIDRTKVRKGAVTPYAGSFAVKVKRHEDAHSLYTEPDFTALQKAMEGKNIPWVLLNFFEDARIEYWYRRNFSKFGWMVHELDLMEKIRKEAKLPESERNILPLGSPEFRPESIFHGIYHVEGERKRLNDLRESCRSAAGPGHFDKGRDKANAAAFYYQISWFVKRAQQCKDTWALIPLMVSWVRMFGTPPEASIIGVDPVPGKGEAGELGAGGHHGDDFSEAIKTAEDSGLTTIDGSGEGEPGGKRTVSTPRHGRGGGPKATGIDHDKCERDKSKDGEDTTPDSDFTPMTTEEKADVKGHRKLLNRESTMSASSIRRAKALAPLLRRALNGGISDKVKKRTPAKRFSAAAWARKSDRPFRGRAEASDGRRKIVVMYDASGSMAGHHHTNGRIFLMALSRLARSRDIEGSVIFCYGPNARLDLPLSDEVICRMDVPGGVEGLADAMEEHKQELSEADLYIAYTDAHLTDKPIDRRFWREHNLPCIALYCGDSGYLDYLKKYFEKAIIREKIEDVAVELVRHVRYSPKA